MASWLTVVTHPTPFAGVIIVSLWIFRRRGEALLRLVAGLVAILARDKRSRADRALEVLRTTVRTEQRRRNTTTNSRGQMHRLEGELPDGAHWGHVTARSIQETMRSAEI